MAQIINITSEALQSTIRRLLPSQQGFGEDLQASNVIMPTIDLTRSAEGAETPQLLQTALAFGSQTAFSINNGTSVMVNTPGFFRVFGGFSTATDAVGSPSVSFSMTDGLTSKTIWAVQLHDGATDAYQAGSYDFVVFLRSGDSISGQALRTTDFLRGSTRQIADVNGILVNPLGFTPQ
tara:strand:+ start:717 stop:1253 length:537 start_codon:yes stop_codon:yes gene_type:complete